MSDPAQKNMATKPLTHHKRVRPKRIETNSDSEKSVVEGTSPTSFLKAVSSAKASKEEDKFESPSPKSLMNHFKQSISKQFWKTSQSFERMEKAFQQHKKDADNAVRFSSEINLQFSRFTARPSSPVIPASSKPTYKFVPSPTNRATTPKSRAEKYRVDMNWSMESPNSIKSPKKSSGSPSHSIKNSSESTHSSPSNKHSSESSTHSSPTNSTPRMDDASPLRYQPKSHVIDVDEMHEALEICQQFGFSSKNDYFSSTAALQCLSFLTQLKYRIKNTKAIYKTKKELKAGRKVGKEQALKIACIEKKKIEDMLSSLTLLYPPNYQYTECYFTGIVKLLKFFEVECLSPVPGSFSSASESLNPFVKLLAVSYCFKEKVKLLRKVLCLKKLKKGRKKRSD